MNPIRMELRFSDSQGRSRSLVPTGRNMRARQHGIEFSAAVSDANGETTIRGSVSNRSDAPIRLHEARFELPTGFPANAPARFFKHGYQSWSGSAIVAVDSIERKDNAQATGGLSHRSEAVRPDDAPEASTSELFTVVESSESAERVLVGFVGAAGHFGALNVRSPARVVARAILDGVTLAQGETRVLEPLLWMRSAKSVSAIASRWAEVLGAAMDARTCAPYQRGWCSWYHYFHRVSEDAMLANVRALAAMRTKCPIDVVQLDDGYQSALGDWDLTNAKFPSGLKRLADEIRDAGFTPGLWTAPFLASRESRLMREHPEWFITHPDSGEPLRAARNPDWTVSDDEFAYALDPSHPGFVEHLEHLYGRLVHDYGYDYLKLDFLYAAAAEGTRNRQDLTRSETLRSGLAAIRRGAGENAFLLGCGCPLGQAVGIVDGMRIGEDVAPYWESPAPHGSGVPGTAQALDAVIARSFMHRRLWLNDPDCLMLRAKETQLSDEERHSLAATIAASGGMLLISDDMSLLDRESALLFQAAARIGVEVDDASRDEPPLAVEIESSALKILSKSLPDGSIHLLLNRGERSERIDLARLGPSGTERVIFELGDEPREAPATLEIAPHAARLVRIRG